jgi:hypothetical protein
VRFCIQTAVRFYVQFTAQGGLKFNYQPIIPEMCLQVVVIGVQRIIKTLAKPCVCKLLMESYRDLYNKSDTCRRDLNLVYRAGDKMRAGNFKISSCQVAVRAAPTFTTLFAFSTLNK